MSWLSADRVVLIAALVVTFVAQKAHESAVDALPPRERDTMRELLRRQSVVLALYAAIVASELARSRLGLTIVPATAPPAIGLVAATILFLIRRRAHRVYELAAEDGDHGQIRRSRELQRRALLAFGASGALWGGLLLLRAH
jgi:hypothetical protein